MRRTAAVSLSGLAVLTVGVLGAPAVRAAQPIRRSFDLPVRIALDVESSPCAGSPQPRLAIQGRLFLGGLRAAVTSAGDAVEASLRPGGTSVALLPVGQTLGIARRALTPQAATSIVKRDPYLWLQLFDDRGRALTGEIFLGRFAQGRFQAEGIFGLPAAARASVLPAACMDSRGSSACLVVRGDLRVSGLVGRLALRDRAAAEPLGAVVTPLLPRARVLPFESRPVRAAGHSASALLLQFLRGDGEEFGAREATGR